jgi:hypothetical protein
VIERKLDANLANIVNTVWLLVIPIAAALIGYLLLRAPARLRELEARCPALRAGVIGAAVLLLLGFALNDSGIRVPGLMLVVFDATLVVLLSSRALARERPSHQEPPTRVQRTDPVPVP